MRTLKNYHILITGPSGSGKSYFAKALRNLGYPVEDADHIPGLGYFIDKKGAYTEFNPVGDLDWFSEHTYIWNKEVLENYLHNKSRIIICGVTTNQSETIDKFDQIFYLKLKKEEILKNLNNDDRENAYGKTAEQQQYASEGVDLFYNNIPDGWIPLSSRDPQKLIEEIEIHLNAKLAK